MTKIIIITNLQVLFLFAYFSLYGYILSIASELSKTELVMKNWLQIIFHISLNSSNNIIE